MPTPILGWPTWTGGDIPDGAAQTSALATAIETSLTAGGSWMQATLTAQITVGAGETDGNLSLLAESGGWTESTGTLHCPATGLYLLGFAQRVTASSAGAALLKVNGASTLIHRTAVTGGANVTAATTRLVALTAGDTLDVAATGNGNVYATGGESHYYAMNVGLAT